MNWLRIGAALAAALLLTYGGYRFIEHQRDIGRAEVQAKWDAQKVADKLAADKQESDWRTKYDAAINQGAENAKAARLSAAAANAAADSLRNTSDQISRLLPGATAEAARTYAAAYQAVFTDCVGRYKAMGEAAQGHANDAATLSAGWPTNGKEADPR